MQQGPEAGGSCRLHTPAGRAHARRQAAAAAALPQPLRAAWAVAMQRVRRRGRVQQPDEAWRHVRSGTSMWCSPINPVEGRRDWS